MREPEPQETLYWVVRELVQRRIPTQFGWSFLELKMPDDEHEHDAHFQIRQFLAEATAGAQAKGELRPRSRVEYFRTFLVPSEPAVRIEGAYVRPVPFTAAVGLVGPATGTAAGFVNLEAGAQVAGAVVQHADIGPGRDVVAQNIRVFLCNAYCTATSVTPHDFLEHRIKVWDFVLGDIFGRRVRPRSSRFREFRDKSGTEPLLDLRIVR